MLRKGRGKAGAASDGDDFLRCNHSVRTIIAYADRHPLGTKNELRSPNTYVHASRPTQKESCLSVLGRVCFIAVVALQGLPANAEVLRCNGRFAEEGDSRLSVLHKCGQPLLADSYCAPVYYSGTPYVVPQPFASIYVPCQQTEEWLYDRGPGNFMATVRFRSGVVQSITYNRAPR